MTTEKRQSKVWCWLNCTLLLIVLLIGLIGFPSFAIADSRLPTRLWQPTVDAQGNPVNVLLPDWSQITLSSLPAINSNGSFNGQPYIPQVGYDLSRTWQIGMTPDQYLKLGDLAEALQPQVFSLDAISQIIGGDLQQMALSDFKLAGEQTIQHLVEIVPDLGSLKVAEVAPIKALFESVLPQMNGMIGLDGSGSALTTTIAEAIANTPALGELKLGAIDLSAFKIDEIPNLSAVELQQFQQWENSFLSEVPGLNQVPLSNFPQPIAEVGGVVMRIDAIYGAAENQRQRTVSGSYQQGFAVPCQETQCAYIELDDLEGSGRSVRGTLEGKQWISGKYQEVQGGFGVLEAINGGKEPTGRHPFGDAFKVVVMEPDEPSDTVDTALFFRYCHRGIPDLGCTPYFIGPVPFFSYKVNAPIFVGLLDNRTSSGGSSQPTGAVRHSSGGQYNGNRPTAGTADPDCFRSTGMAAAEVDVKALASAIAGIESVGSGGYFAIGVHTCADGGRNCGRALGRYQFMSYNGHAATLIAARPGGQAFLGKVKAGHTPTQAEIMQYFPPEDQERAFQQSLTELAGRASRQVDPTTGQPFNGSRLIERIAQMHFGGPHSKIDGGSSDALGRLSLKDYGQEAAKRYRTLATTSTCAPTVGAADRPTLQAHQPLLNRTPGGWDGMVRPVAQGQIAEMPQPLLRGQQRQKGLNLVATEKASIQAAMVGTVIYAGWADGYGNLVIVEHDSGRQTRYAHLSSIAASIGATVKRGQVIGEIDNVGTAVPHLYFEVRVGATSGQPFSGKAVDPQLYANFQA